ncbi:hypothetical protein QTN25_010150 [Entamoeba marina]
MQPKQLEPFYLINVLLYVENETVLSFEFISKNCGEAIKMLHTNPWKNPTEKVLNDILSMFKHFPRLKTLQIDTRTLLALPDEYIDLVERVQIVDKDVVVGGYFSNKLVVSNRLLLVEDQYLKLQKMMIRASQFTTFLQNILKFPNLKLLRIDRCSDMSKYFTQIRSLVLSNINIALVSVNIKDVESNKATFGALVTYAIDTGTAIRVIRLKDSYTENNYQLLSLENPSFYKQLLYSQNLKVSSKERIKLNSFLEMSPTNLYKNYLFKQGIRLAHSDSFKEVKTIKDLPQILRVNSYQNYYGGNVPIIVIMTKEGNIFGFDCIYNNYNDPYYPLSHSCSTLFSFAQNTQPIFNVWKAHNFSQELFIYLQHFLNQKQYLLYLGDKNCGLSIDRIGGTGKIWNLGSAFVGLRDEDLICYPSFSIHRIIIYNTQRFLNY